MTFRTFRNASTRRIGSEEARRLLHSTTAGQPPGPQTDAEVAAQPGLVRLRRTRDARLAHRIDPNTRQIDYSTPQVGVYENTRPLSVPAYRSASTSRRPSSKGGASSKDGDSIGSRSSAPDPAGPPPGRFSNGTMEASSGGAPRHRYTLDEVLGEPRFVGQEGDVGYFEPAGGGPARAVHLPSAPSFAAIVNRLMASEPDPVGGLSAGPMTAGAGDFTSRFDRPMTATDARAVAPRAPDDVPPMLARPTDPAPQQVPPAARVAPQLAAPQAQPPTAPDASRVDPFTATVGPDPLAQARQMFTRPAAPHNDPSAFAGERWIGADGQVVSAGAPIASPQAQPRGRGAARQAAPAGPVMSQDEQLIDALINQPGPLVPGDFRPESLGDRTARAVDEARQLQQHGAEVAGGAAAEREDLLTGRQDANAVLEDERQGAMRMATQRYDAAVRTMAESTIDPNRYFSERGGAAGRIGAAIATALGAIGGTLTGQGGNMALDIIQAEIQRDIGAQRDNQAQTRAGVDAARGFLDITRREFTDRQAAEDAAQSIAWQAVSQRVGQHAAQLQSEEARQRAQALQLQADQQAAQFAATAQEREFRTEMELRTLQANTLRAEARASREQRRARGGTGGGPGLQMPPSWTQGRGAWDGLTRSQQQAAIGRMGTRAPTGGAAGGRPNDLQVRLAAASDAISQLRRAVPDEGDIPGVGTLDSRRGTGWLQSDAGRRVRTLGMNAVRRFLRLESGAAISEDEMTQELEIRGMSEGASEAQFRVGLDQLERDMRVRVAQFQDGVQSPDAPEQPLPPGVRRR